MNSPETTSLSFEVFPPKPTSNQRTIYHALDEIRDLNPDFISVTYGAGGSTNCENTVKIATYIQKSCHVESVVHLPGLYLSEAEVLAILEDLQKNEIQNVLVLRGNDSSVQTPAGRFFHADELMQFLHAHVPQLQLLAACYPEGHPENQTAEEEFQTMQRKEEAGASQFLTQLFLDNDTFYTFRNQAAQHGISIPIKAGIMPITNLRQAERVKQCGATLPKKFQRILEKYADHPDALREAGIAYALEQIVDLIAQDVDGIHLYIMNNAKLARQIYDTVYRML